jgi:hypothetical protein
MPVWFYRGDTPSSFCDDLLRFNRGPPAEVREMAASLSWTSTTLMLSHLQKRWRCGEKNETCLGLV